MGHIFSMNVALWILQGLLAFAFVGAGAMKLFKSRDALVSDPKMGWAADFSSSQIKLIALAEVLGGVGLVLPMAIGVLPILTPWAAIALAVLMAGAAWTHIRRNEPPVPPIVLGVLSACIAVGRWVL